MNNKKFISTTSMAILAVNSIFSNISIKAMIPLSYAMVSQYKTYLNELYKDCPLNEEKLVQEALKELPEILNKNTYVLSTDDKIKIMSKIWKPDGDWNEKFITKIETKKYMEKVPHCLGTTVLSPFNYLLDSLIIYYLPSEKGLAANNVREFIKYRVAEYLQLPVLMEVIEDDERKLSFKCFYTDYNLSESQHNFFCLTMPERTDYNMRWHDLNLIKLETCKYSLYNYQINNEWSLSDCAKRLKYHYQSALEVDKQGVINIPCKDIVAAFNSNKTEDENRNWIWRKTVATVPNINLVLRFPL